MQIDLGHHVYSSLNGYRTLFATPGLPAAAAAFAEDVARRLYRIVGSRPQRAFFRPAAGLCAALRGFPFGTDHAGRARTCVHTVFFDERQLARAPWFNPFEIPDDLFLGEVEDLQYLSGYLRRTWSYAAPEPPSTLWRRVAPAVREEVVRALVPALLEDRRATLVLDRSETSFPFAGVLVNALPPEARRRVTYLDRALLPPMSPPVFRMNFFANRPDESVWSGQEIVIDFDRGVETHNDPERNAWTDLVLAGLAPGGDADRVWTLAAALERAEPDRGFTKFQYLQLADAWKKAAPLFRPDGAPDLGAAAKEAVAEVNEACPLLLRAGCARLAVELVRDVSAWVERRIKDADKAAKLRRRTDAVLLAAQEAQPALEHKLTSLVDELRPAFGRAKLGGADADDTFLNPPPSEPMANFTGFED